MTGRVQAVSIRWCQKVLIFMATILAYSATKMQGDLHIVASLCVLVANQFARAVAWGGIGNTSLAEGLIRQGLARVFTRGVGGTLVKD